MSHSVALGDMFVHSDEHGHCCVFLPTYSCWKYSLMHQECIPLQLQCLTVLKCVQTEHKANFIWCYLCTNISCSVCAVWLDLCVYLYLWALFESSFSDCSHNSPGALSLSFPQFLVLLLFSLHGYEVDSYSLGMSSKLFSACLDASSQFYLYIQES